MRAGVIHASPDNAAKALPSGAVSIGARESQLFLVRGDKLAARLGLPTIVLAPNLPLPTKVVPGLDPVDVIAQFGEDPDVVRSTPTSARSCRTPSAGWPASAGSRCWADR